MGRPDGLVGLVLLVTSLVALVHSQEISCKNNIGRNVDWFVVHKLPRLQPSPRAPSPAGLRTGDTFRFLEPGSRGNRWSVSPVGIGRTNTMIAITLRQAAMREVAIMGYNDQPPIGSARGDSAHSKGTILVNSRTGNAVWLSHSVPQWPDIRGLKAGRYSYEDARKRNGQTFMCLTLNRNALESLGRHLYHMKAHSYDAQPANLAAQIQRLAPWLFLVVQKDFRQPMGQSTFRIRTRGGLSVTLFSKPPAANGRDIWSQRVAPGIRDNIYVQSWQCGGGTLLPRETSGRVSTNNVGKIYVPWGIVKTRPARTENWYNGPTKDHSKFAVGNSPRGAHVCIGDMNRRSTQLPRGGGAACFSNRNVWQAYYRLLTGTPPRRIEPPARAEMQCDID